MSSPDGALRWSGRLLSASSSSERPGSNPATVGSDDRQEQSPGLNQSCVPPPGNRFFEIVTWHDPVTAAIAPAVIGTMLPVMVNQSTLLTLIGDGPWRVSELLPLIVTFLARKPAPVGSATATLSPRPTTRLFVNH